VEKHILKIGTRASKLALWQAEHVASLLERAGMTTQIIPIETKGDQILEVSISKIGSKGVFTQELEEQLHLGTIDIAVHSAKDMPSQLGEGLELIAFTAREKANDILLSRKKDISISAQENPLVIGTSSTRRVATLRHFYPQISTVEVRGNLQTRLKKMDEGLCDALLLAYAGVHRMGYDALIVQELDLEQFTPAVGQGSVAIEASTALAEKLKSSIIAACNDPKTHLCLRAERAYLRVLEGGCSIPVFALAQLQGEQIHLQGGILSLDGKERISLKIQGNLESPEALGEQLAMQVLQAGGKKILVDIKKNIHGYDT
jgi:hydroxymethylbilane synthase